MNKHKNLVCANCSCEIEHEYYTVADNFLQIKYFEEQDGSDNIFCSQDCLCQSLSVMNVLIDEDKRKHWEMNNNFEVGDIVVIVNSLYFNEEQVDHNVDSLIIYSNQICLTEGKEAQVIDVDGDYVLVKELINPLHDLEFWIEKKDVKRIEEKSEKNKD